MITEVINPPLRPVLAERYTRLILLGATKGRISGLTAFSDEMDR